MSTVDQRGSACGDALLRQQEFSELGLHEIGYLRIMPSDDLKRIYGARFPSVMDIASVTVYALMDAEGDPLVLCDSVESVRESAREEGLILILLQ
jgi:hypothetical protein